MSIVVDRSEYTYKKVIADNLEEMINKKFIEISNEEYDRINNAIDTYSEAITQKIEELNNVVITTEQKAQLILKLQKLESDINDLKEVAYDTISVDEGTMDISDVK